MLISVTFFQQEATSRYDDMDEGPQTPGTLRILGFGDEIMHPPIISRKRLVADDRIFALIVPGIVSLSVKAESLSRAGSLEASTAKVRYVGRRNHRPHF